MVGGHYVPDRGQIVWIDHDPSAGHEQSKRRPALVLTPRSYNEASGLALMCPITSKKKGYPFELLLPPGSPAEGVILTDQVRCFDWKERKVEYVGSVPESVMQDAFDLIGSLLDG